MSLSKAAIGAIKAAAFASLAIATGCASSSISHRQPMEARTLARPARVWVRDFAGSAIDIPSESSLAGQSSTNITPQTAEQIAEGRRLGAQIAALLVQEISEMGMPASLASAGVKPQINDLVIDGAILSIEEGSATKRVAVGFSAGQSELKVAVEGFQVTPNGLQKLGSGDVQSAGNKTPGSAMGLAVLIATSNPAGLIVSTGMKVYGEKSGSNTIEGRAKKIADEISDALKKRFQEQGWITT